jgi:hypothetical protein
MSTYFQLPTGKTLKINDILHFTDDFDENYQKAIAFDKGEYINNPFISKVKEDDINSENDDEESEIDDILREYKLPILDNIEEIDIQDDIL